jgi:hypothetical protein
MQIRLNRRVRAELVEALPFLFLGKAKVRASTGSARTGTE